MATKKEKKVKEAKKISSVPIFNSKGEKIEKFELDKELFTGEVNKGALYLFVRMYNANQRRGTAACAASQSFTLNPSFIGAHADKIVLFYFHKIYICPGRGKLNVPSNQAANTINIHLIQGIHKNHNMRNTGINEINPNQAAINL